MFACFSCFGQEGPAGGHGSRRDDSPSSESTAQVRQHRAPRVETWLEELSSADDVNAASNFLRIMKNERVLKAFHGYLETQYCIENLKFVLAVDEFKTTDPNQKIETAKTIFDTYLDPSSEFEISISGPEREAIRASINQGNVSSQMFDAVSQNVALTLQLEHVKRFHAQVQSHVACAG